jgi:hypothetical protein
VDELFELALDVEDGEEMGELEQGGDSEREVWLERIGIVGVDGGLGSSSGFGIDAGHLV